MKSYFALVCLASILLMSSCSRSSHTTPLSTSGAAIEFESTEHDYGTIPYKSDGIYEFVFRNTGTEPLVLKNVKSTCGCTVPQWTKEPIKKGGKGKIKVSYNTRITGGFSKSISVYSNASEDPVVLVIKGNVEREE